jgi:hypothetical protein
MTGSGSGPLTCDVTWPKNPSVFPSRFMSTSYKLRRTLLKNWQPESMAAAETAITAWRREKEGKDTVVSSMWQLRVAGRWAERLRGCIDLQEPRKKWG